MSWLEFIAKIISALAWPTAFLVALFMLREHIVSLVPGLRRLKYKGIELEFSESLKELTRKAPTKVLKWTPCQGQFSPKIKVRFFLRRHQV
jgi:hypothetical protein